jgi:hypothetical protein
MLECPNCGKPVHVGTAGHKNLEAHRASKACRTHANKEKAKTKPEKANQVLNTFFKPHAPLNPSTVSAPPPICPGKRPGALAPDDPQAYPEPAEQPAGAAAVKSLKALSGQVTTGATVLQGRSTASQLPAQHVVDKNAISLLQDLKSQGGG